MKKNLAFAALACVALALGGCANTPPPAFGTVTPGGQGTATTDPVVAKVQDATAKVCSFVPTVSTVASIISTFTGGGAIVDLVGNVAGSICSSLAKKTMTRGGGVKTPSVNGVPIQGYYIR